MPSRTGTPTPVNPRETLTLMKTVAHETRPSRHTALTTHWPSLPSRTARPRRLGSPRRSRRAASGRACCAQRAIGKGDWKGQLRQGATAFGRGLRADATAFGRGLRADATALLGGGARPKRVRAFRQTQLRRAHHTPHTAGGQGTLQKKSQIMTRMISQNKTQVIAPCSLDHSITQHLTW